MGDAGAWRTAITPRRVSFLLGRIVLSAITPITLCEVTGRSSGQTTLTNVGFIPNAAGSMGACQISGNGRVVVGTSWPPGTFNGVAVLWSAESGTALLPGLPDPSHSRAVDANDDGSAILGRVTDYLGREEIALWTWRSGAATVRALPVISVPDFSAISGNGRVIVGYRSPTVDRFSAIAYVDLSSTRLDSMAAFPSTVASAVSNDGAYIAGWQSTSLDSSGTRHAVRWNSRREIEDLGALPVYTQSQAYAISGDGSTVVGYARAPLSRAHAFRWTRASGMLDLGLLPTATDSYANCVNGNGGVVGGWSGEALSNRAFVWTPIHGMVELQPYLARSGVDMAGWTLRVVDGISADGTFLAGRGTLNGQSCAWHISGLRLACLADIDDGSGSGSPDGSTTIDDLLYYLLLYAEGSSRADVDDGSGSATLDGGVSIEDLLYFLARYEQGC